MREPANPASTRTTQIFTWPLSPEAHDDPYPFYERLRSEDPVHFSSAGVWLLTRYEDALFALRDPRFSNDHSQAETSTRESNPFAPMMQVLMLFRDPPDHTRLRTLVNKAFTPRVAEGLRPKIKQIVGELLDKVQPSGVMDVISDVAYPLPVIVICELLGVPKDDLPLIRKWSRALIRTIDPISSPEDMSDMVMEVAPAGLELGSYFQQLIDERRKSPRGDLLSALIGAEEAGDRLSEEELLVMCGLILIAGHETTMNLIGNGTLALLSNPEQMERLRREPSIIRSAIEELLRYDSPVQLTARTAVEDVEIGGKKVRARQQSVVLLGAANRDPDRFSSPDRLDLGREDNHHLAFGAGHHFCVGAPLARVEAQIAIQEMVGRLDKLHLAADSLEWRETTTIRGLNSLPVAFQSVT
jgi:cytochrome P450